MIVLSTYALFESSQIKPNILVIKSNAVNWSVSSKITIRILFSGNIHNLSNAIHRYEYTFYFIILDYTEHSNCIKKVTFHAASKPAYTLHKYLETLILTSQRKHNGTRLDHT